MVTVSVQLTEWDSSGGRGRADFSAGTWQPNTGDLLGAGGVGGEAAGEYLLFSDKPLNQNLSGLAEWSL